MFGLLRKLAWANLVNNRKLYYPFALATIFSSAIFYIFLSLTVNPNMSKVYDAGTVFMTLAMGTFIVALTIGIIILYANSVVFKNRSQELGLYGMLGLTKSNLITMNFMETLMFALPTLLIGLGLGVILDKLFYALLLKLMHFKVELVSVFQPYVLFVTLFILLAIFGFVWLTNSLRIVRYDMLALSKEKRAGERKGRFLILQTILGLALVGTGYYLAITIKSPIAAIVIFFLAVLLVIAGTYLLFNAGTTVLLRTLKTNKRFYYKTQNMIAVSNLIYRLKKNAVGLATICILSSMVLVTMIGGMSIYVGNGAYARKANPYDASIQLNGEYSATKEQVQTSLNHYLEEKGAKPIKTAAITYKSFYMSGFANQEIQLLEDSASAFQTGGAPAAIGYLLDASEYQALTGKTADLSGNQALLYDNQGKFSKGENLTLAGQKLQVKSLLNQDITSGNIPNYIASVVDRTIILVVDDQHPLMTQASTPALKRALMVGSNLDLSEEKQLDLKLEEGLTDLAYDLIKDVKVQDPMKVSFDTGAYAFMLKGLRTLTGSLLFIGVLLSLTFIMGTVLVIYYKQISEGYEDRENFVILQKVGLDEKQVNTTIRKQVLTVFFLPVIIAFLHLAFASKMLRLILLLLGAGDISIILTVAAVVGACFILIYILVFLITSRSYRRIVAR